jgi:predicted RND superfamily exporter protein
MSGTEGLDLHLLAAAGPAAGLLLPPFLRALRGAATALLPNLLPASFLVVSLTILGRSGGLALAILLLVGLGVALDDLREFLRGYRRSFVDGHEHGAALRRALRGVLRPLLATLATAAGGLLLLLAFDGSPAGRAGSTALLVTGLALLADLCLLPIGVLCCRDQG